MTTIILAVGSVLNILANGYKETIPARILEVKPLTRQVRVQYLRVKVLHSGVELTVRHKGSTGQYEQID